MSIVKSNSPANALMATARCRRIDAPEIVGRPLESADDLVRIFTENDRGRKCILRAVRDLISEARFMGDFATFHLALRLKDTCIDWYRLDPQGLEQLMNRPVADWMEVADRLLELTERPKKARRVTERSTDAGPVLPL